MRWINFFFVLVVTPVYACEDIAYRQQIIEYLMQDQEFVEFVCGVEPCSANKLGAGVEYRSEILSIDGRIVSCFVEPIRKARNFYTGVFVMIDQQPPQPQFIFFGSGIGVTKKLFRGLKVLEGHEIGEAGAKEIHTFKWDGNAYIERQSAKGSKVIRH